LEFRSNNTERQPVRHVYECNPCRAKVAAALEAPPPVPVSKWTFAPSISPPSGNSSTQL